ncbi:hypothetical protein [Sporolactobacillus spathodeae]|uniref:Uncharacterized protein n=1 Tax=Sporolactobacillus spathodeae TaxID=1465502 RepID=A0ABS2Q6Z0_9BACL|nr:hypothetical protein [Sporolactobacillus spathodeae]MBM7657557.1 hypothetical protein [Sporolactobacillus spathodeae]
MTYRRYKSDVTLSKKEKEELIAQYISYYENLIAKQGIDVLNVKIAREVFEPILDKIGTLLNMQANKLAHEDGDVKNFLEANPLPPKMKELLSDDFRAFSLLLNALKQWVSAESAATDRFLLGGAARDLCRSAVDHCMVTGEDLGERPELHHPLRDGRPPILLSKIGHSTIEHQQGNDSFSDGSEDKVWNRIKQIKRERHMSWVQLREGCMAIQTGNTGYRTNAKSFANKVIRELDLSAAKIIDVLNQNNV